MKHPATTIEVLPPRPLSAMEILAADLTCSPPPGFPALPPKQAALVQRRVQFPAEPWSESLRAAGYAEGQAMRGRAQVSAGGSMYLKAYAQSVAVQAGDPSDLRAAAIDRLAREVREAPDGRVAVAAAKVLTDYLPDAPVPRHEDLEALSVDELSDRLIARLESILEHCAATLSSAALRRQSAVPAVNENVAGTAGRILDLARRFAALADRWTSRAD